MTVYLVNIGLILFWRLYYVRNRIADSRKYYCAIVAIQWILISGLRDWSIGADTENYYVMFEKAQSTSWISAFRSLLNYSLQDVLSRDPGYLILTKIFQLFSGSYQLFLFAVAAFFMSMMAVWIYRYSASPCTSFILFSTLFFSYETLTRQNIAIALVVFLGYDLIRKRKFWSFATVAFLAFLIHKTSLVFVPMYFLCSLPVTWRYRSLCAILIAMAGYFGKVFYVPIAEWIGIDSALIDYAEGGAELYATLLILLCVVIWILYPRIKKHRNDAGMLFHINSMSLMSAVLIFHNQSFMRIQLYFSLFLMITIPEVINTVKREYRLLIYLLFGLVMIFYLILQKPEYQFFFMR